MANSKGHRYANSFKHEVCQYYEHHTRNDTEAKYGVAGKTISKWRVALGYRNKFFGHNIYTEAMQPTFKKRERRDFMVMKSELTDLRVALMYKDYDYSKIENQILTIADTIRKQQEV